MLNVRALTPRRIVNPDTSRVVLVETLGTIVGMAAVPPSRRAIENPTVDVHWHNSVVVRHDTGEVRLESDFVERGVSFIEVACIGNPSGTYGMIAADVDEVDE